MFEIVSIGRIDFLVSVLNGLAMITSDAGPAGYGGMVALGLLIGVIIVMARAVVTQRLELQYVLAGWLLYACLFVPKVTVNVEDIYTGDVLSVANVPLGPAAIGSITSTLGVRLADAFTAVFAYPSMTKSGYMDSLDLIHSMRDMDVGGANDGDPANNIKGIDVERSLRAYLVDCVMYDMMMDLPEHSVTWNKLRESPNLMRDIRVVSETWFTTIYLTADREAGEVTTCTDAYTAIDQFVDTTFYPAWNTYVSSKLHVDDGAVAIQGALDAIFTIGKDAKIYMLNSLMKKELELAQIGYQSASTNPAGVIMRVQAMQQRRTQWAAEQSMWAEMARPAIGFLEGFFYAASPFVAFMFCLGAPGISLFGRYLLLAVWIQLWMPILAICNLFITIAASNDLQQIQASGTDPLTISGLNSVWTETGSWLAFGGAMVAATPLLSLILITGSYFALTSLSNRLSGADHVDEKVVSPDIMAPSAFASTGAMGMQSSTYSSDPQRGLVETNVAQTLPSINFGSAMSASVQSAYSKQVQAQKEMSESFSTGVDLTQQKNRDHLTQQLHANGWTGRHSFADNFIDQQVNQINQNYTKDHAYSNTNQDVVATAFGVALDLSAKGGKGGKGGGAGASGGAGIDLTPIKATLQNMRGVTDQQRDQIANQIAQSVNANSTMTAGLEHAIRQDETEGLSSRYMSAIGVTDAGKWADAHRDVVSANQAYQEAIERSNNAGLQGNLEPVIVAEQAMQRGWDKEVLVAAYSHPGDINIEAMQANIERLSTGRNHMPHDKAQVAAAASALGSGNFAARMALMEILDKHGYGIGVKLKDPDANAGIAKDAPKIGATTKRVEGRVSHDTDIPPEVVRSDVQSNMSAGPDFKNSGITQAVDLFENGKKENFEQRQQALDSQEKSLTELKGNFAEEHQHKRGPLETLNSQDWAGQVWNLDIDINSLKEGAKHFPSGVADGTNKALDHWYTAPVAGLVGLGAGVGEFFSKADSKYDEQVVASSAAAKQEALDKGFSPEAAEYYGYQHVIFRDMTTTGVSRLFNNDPEYEKLKATVREQLGDKGMEMLNQASTGDEISKAQNFEGALDIYKRNQLYKGAQEGAKEIAEAPATAAPGAAPPAGPEG